MNVGALIDAIVRQTTVLLAQLATAGGNRPQLAHTANQVFLDLVDGLKEQGLTSKVIADMFGLAVRTYHAKLQRLSESRTVRGRSLWEALLEYIETKGPVLRNDVLARFSYDDPLTVRGVLKDLVESGVVYQTGRGDHVQYRAADGTDCASSNGITEETDTVYAEDGNLGWQWRSGLTNTLVTEIGIGTAHGQNGIVGPHIFDQP